MSQTKKKTNNTTHEKRNKDYLTLANERAERQQQEKADKQALEREKFNHQKKKDAANKILSLIVGLPIFTIIITFTIIGLKILIGTG